MSWLHRFWVSSPSIWRQVTLGLLLGGWPLPTWAQQSPYPLETVPQRGFMPNSVHSGGGFDSIDVVNGNLKLAIPLASLPAGRGGMSFDLDLIYNSQIYDIQVGERTAPGGQLVNSQELISGTTGGWTYNFANYKLDLEVRQAPSSGFTCTTTEAARIFRVRVGLPDGSMHTLHLRNYGDELGDGYYGDGFYGIHPAGLRSLCARMSSHYPADLTGRLYYYLNYAQLRSGSATGPC